MGREALSAAQKAAGNWMIRWDALSAAKKAFGVLVSDGLQRLVGAGGCVEGSSSVDLR